MKSSLAAASETSMTAAAGLATESPPDAGPADALRACDAETIESFSAAEVLYVMARAESGRAFARSAAFAFCFAVENEVRLRLGGKLRKLLNKRGHESTSRLLLEPSRRGLSPFFQRYLILARKNGGPNPLEHASLENYLHVLARMAELGPKYRPDGLKAFGVILICLGTDFSLDGGNRTAATAGAREVRACLKLAGDDATVRTLASSLMRLQHLRNPYVHPESGEMRDLREVREEAEQCLKGIHAVA